MPEIAKVNIYKGFLIKFNNLGVSPKLPSLEKEGSLDFAAMPLDVRKSSAFPSRPFRIRGYAALRADILNCRWL